MAWKLLDRWAMKSLLLSGALMGCYFVPSVVEGDTPIAGENLAPSVISEQPQFETFPAVLMLQPESVTFRFDQVEDPNLEDNLTVRFYADGKDDFLVGLEFPVGVSGNAARPSTNVEFILDEAQLTAFRDSGGNLVGLHRLEAIISDRGFVSDSGEGARQVPPEARQSYYYWVLDFGQCCVCE